MVNCSILTCKNRSEKQNVPLHGISYHRYPKNIFIRKKWIIATGNMEGWSPSTNAVVCSKHFRDEDFIHKKIRILHPNAIPLVHLPSHVIMSSLDCEAVSNGDDIPDVEDNMEIKKRLNPAFAVRSIDEGKPGPSKPKKRKKSENGDDSYEMLLVMDQFVETVLMDGDDTPVSTSVDEEDESGQESSRHRLGKTHLQDRRRRFLRRRCIHCYERIKREGKTSVETRDLTKKVNTVCLICPSKPSVCSDCFTNIHRKL